MLRTGSVRRFFGFNYPCPRKLRQIMKMSMIERETPERIKDIWDDYHHARTENISHSLTKEEYETLKSQYVDRHAVLSKLRCSYYQSEDKADTSNCFRKPKTIAICSRTWRTSRSMGLWRHRTSC